MFLGDRLPIVQRMILADNPTDEDAALEELRAQQESDFVGILEAMDGLPVTVRLLDPPLHEFLPDHEELIVKQAQGRAHRAESGSCCTASEFWRESNPMLGTRGCRLGILKPGLYRMQVRALMQAAVTRKQAGGNPIVEIMIPLIVSEPELTLLEQWAREEADAVVRDAGVDVDYLVGTMIETPRAALVADGIADVAEFFSFGTNDLTQMTFGFSRDDVEGRFMAEYLEHKLLPREPVRDARRRRRRPARAHGLSRRAARRATRHQARHLRRARRRSRVGRVLPRGRPRLRVVLAVPRADRPARGRARRAGSGGPGLHRLKQRLDRRRDHRVPRTRCSPARWSTSRSKTCEPMRARVRMLFHDYRLRPGGTISGPSLMTLADTGVWVALLAMIGREPLSVTSHLDIDFLRKPAPADVIAHTTLHKVGKRLAVGDVLMYSDGETCRARAHR